MWQKYLNATSLSEVFEALSIYKEKARIAAGTTDLILELERGVRPGVELLIDITWIPGFDRITLDEDDTIHLGPMVTHNDCVASKLILEGAYPLALACWEVGSPQIRNRGTIAGNLVTASPANDAIPPLMALGATVTLKSINRVRTVPLADFYTGVRRTIMEPDEMLVDISFKRLAANQKSAFYKLGLRNAQAISVANTSVVITFDKEAVIHASITLGSVAPTVIHAEEAERFLTGKELTQETISAAAEKAMLAASPISDIRGSDRYRKRMIKTIVTRALTSIQKGKMIEDFPQDPVLLSTAAEKSDLTTKWTDDQPIRCTINGEEFTFFSGHTKTLLRLLREEGLMVGTKEGCAEGECGACTVFLDGQAVMSCLVPAPRAHGSNIITIEGIGREQLHPVQEAFVSKGAVQCGYCTPGFIMSAVKLLEEKHQPTTEQIKQAITGNLCRCTGYYKIIEAIEDAANHERV